MLPGGGPHINNLFSFSKSNFQGETLLVSKIVEIAEPFLIYMNFGQKWTTIVNSSLPDHGRRVCSVLEVTYKTWSLEELRVESCIKYPILPVLVFA